MAVPHFRGCSGQINLRARAYHSGDHEEVGWILRRLRERTPGRMLVVGISLGGNALLRWTQEMGSQAATVASAVAAVCAPLDLNICGQALGQGFNQQIYTRMFLHTMKPRALAKLAQYPGLFDGQRLMAARTLFEFDDVFTAPLHGFRDAHDYWTRASARPHLHRIALPALIVNPRNDPFVPAACLPGPAQCSPLVTLAQPEEGGHVGFPAGAFPAQVHSVPEQVAHWLDQHG
jgi:predicted alpha/beta-fold hydrolase